VKLFLACREQISSICSWLICSLAIHWIVRASRLLHVAAFGDIEHRSVARLLRPIRPFFPIAAGLQTAATRAETISTIPGKQWSIPARTNLEEIK
jgi:hypothetical protein